MHCSHKSIEEMIEKIASFTEEGDEGFTRFSYTQEDIEAKKYIIKKMKKLNLKVSMDSLGNVFGRKEGRGRELAPILIGSHLDTVKNGGKYDGIAGVVTGLEVLRVIQENDIQTKHPVEVIAFAEEEGGRFNSAFIGSKWFAAKIGEEELKQITDSQSISLEKASKALDILDDEVERCNRKNNDVKAMIELHCEQGPILQNAKKDLGIVNLITGSSSYQIDLSGQADHAGTTPMNVRKDAFYVASKIAVELNEFVKKQEKYCVGTVGFVDVKPNVYNIVPEKVSLIMDIRSADIDVMYNVINHMKGYIDKISQANSVKYNIKKNHHVNPVKMSKHVVNLLTKNAEKRNYDFNVMGSGAGHDTIIMTELTDCAMVFVPSKNGRSHCPEEYSDSKHIAKGADIVLDTVLELAEVIK